MPYTYRHNRKRGKKRGKDSEIICKALMLLNHLKLNVIKFECTRMTRKSKPDSKIKLKE